MMTSPEWTPHFPDNYSISEFDFSVNEYRNFAEVWTVRPSWEVVVKTFAMTIIVLISLPANSIVLYVILKTKSLHTPTNLFILNLSLADLLNSCYSSWNILVVDFFQNFLLGEVLCRANAFFELACMLSSVFSLTIISFDRVLGIIRPFSRRMSKRTAVYIIILVWIFAAGLATPPIIYRTYTERQWADYLEMYCTEDKKALQVYWIILLVILVWLPLLIMTVAYIIITLTFEKYEKRIGNDRNNQVIFKSRQKILQILYRLLLVFFICWCPFQVLILYRNFRISNNRLPLWHSYVYFTAHYMTIVNCAINPFVYGMANKKFQVAFKTNFLWIYGKQSCSQVAPNTSIIL